MAYCRGKSGRYVSRVHVPCKFPACDAFVCMLFASLRAGLVMHPVAVYAVLLQAMRIVRSWKSEQARAVG